MAAPTFRRKKAKRTSMSQDGEGLSKAQTRTWGALTRKTAAANGTHLRQRSTPVEAATATSSKTTVVLEVSAPMSTGAATAPMIPRPARIGASQRIATTVAITAMKKASSKAEGVENRW